MRRVNWLNLSAKTLAYSYFCTKLAYVGGNMFKIVSIMEGALAINTVYSITEINSDEEYVKLPIEKYPGSPITHIGYEQDDYVDTRSDYERWKDEYYHSYYPMRSASPTEVSVSAAVKKIFIPHTVTHISNLAFKNVSNIEFEIDENNKNYKLEDNKIIDISSGEVIWPYSK